MEIGIIGLGAIGKSIARNYNNLGCRINGCDLPEKREALEKEFLGTNIHILADGMAVSRRSDFLFYAVEAENIEQIVKTYGPATKQGAIVIGETSVKTPEAEAFDKYLPSDVDILLCHRLYGPSVTPKGQSLAIIRHRCSDSNYKQALEILQKVGSKMIEIPTYQDHDRITADTQATTQTGFLSMATAWKKRNFFPWENASYIGGIDNVKILLALRILANQAHIYSGIAILNPFARNQINQYAQSASDLFALSISRKGTELKNRIEEAGNFVFDNGDSDNRLNDETLGEFSLGRKEMRKPNSHLSQFALIDSWHRLGIKPHKHNICSTPLSRLRLGIAEYLWSNKALREESLDAFIKDDNIKEDDLAFTIAAHEWASIVQRKDIPGYQEQFEETKKFFNDRIPEGMRKSGELIKKLC